jgi:hypothetical protein
MKNPTNFKDCSESRIIISEQSFLSVIGQLSPCSVHPSLDAGKIHVNVYMA